MIVVKKIVIEKNENINISSTTSTKSTSQIQNIPINKDLNLNQLLENTQKSIGSAKFFLYDGLKNNCQDFIIVLCCSIFTPELLEYGLYTKF